MVLLNSDVRDLARPHHVTLDPQLRSLLQWAAASMADVPHIQLSPDRDLQQVIFLSASPPPPLPLFPGVPAASPAAVVFPLTSPDDSSAPG